MIKPPFMRGLSTPGMPGMTRSGKPHHKLFMSGPRGSGSGKRPSEAAIREAAPGTTFVQIDNLQIPSHVSKIQLGHPVTNITPDLDLAMLCIAGMKQPTVELMRARDGVWSISLSRTFQMSTETMLQVDDGVISIRQPSAEPVAADDAESAIGKTHAGFSYHTDLKPGWHVLHAFDSSIRLWIPEATPHRPFVPRPQVSDFDLSVFGLRTRPQDAVMKPAFYIGKLTPTPSTAKQRYKQEGEKAVRVHFSGVQPSSWLLGKYLRLRSNPLKQRIELTRAATVRPLNLWSLCGADLSVRDLATNTDLASRFASTARQIAPGNFEITDPTFGEWSYQLSLVLFSPHNPQFLGTAVTVHNMRFLAQEARYKIARGEQGTLLLTPTRGVLLDSTKEAPPKTWQHPQLRMISVARNSYGQFIPEIPARQDKQVGDPTDEFVAPQQSVRTPLSEDARNELKRLPHWSPDFDLNWYREG